MGQRDGHRPQPSRGDDGLDTDALRLGSEDRRQTRTLGKLVRTPMCARAERREQPPDVHDVALHELGRGHEPGLERLLRIDRRQPLLERLGIERSLDHRLDQLVLVGEDVEDRPLRHAGALGDLLRGDGRAVLDDQRPDGRGRSPRAAQQAEGESPECARMSAGR